MSYEATLWGMAAAGAVLALSLYFVRRPRGDSLKVPWFPWNGVMFLSLTLLVLMAVNLAEVWPR